MKKLLGLTLDGLRDVAAEVGLRPFAAKQMAAWLYQKRVTDIDAMTDLPKRARQALAERYTVGREQPLVEMRSSAGITYISNPPLRSDAKAIDLPSGLHTGAFSYEGVEVSLWALPPFTSTLYISPL